MKKFIFGVLAIASVSVISCEKFSFDKFDKFEKEEYGECGIVDISICDDDTYEDPNNIASDVTTYILEPIVYSDDCDCIVSGYVKYLKNNKTVALVNYGNGNCDEYGTKVICVNGDCDDKNAYTCEFTLDCESISTE